MRRRDFLLLVLILLDLSRVTGAVLAEDKLYLGVSAPFSGSGANWANDFRNVLTFANDKLASGRYSFIFEDDRCEHKSAPSVAHKLARINKVNEVFILCGQSVLATAKAYREAGVTVVAPLATPSRISSLGIFRTSLNDKVAAQLLAKQVFEHDSSVTILTEENDYSVEFSLDFLRAAKELNLSVSSHSHIPGENDFRPQLLKFKQAGVRSLFLNSQSETTLSTLVNQLSQIRYAPNLYGAYIPGSASFLKLVGKKADGLIFVDFPSAEKLLTSQGLQLLGEYKSRFGELQGWSFIFPATFEGFRAIHQGRQQSDPINSYLLRTKFSGIFGDYRFDKNGDIIGPTHVMKIIRNGQAKELREEKVRT